jgi:hypothetical protein
MLYNEYNLLDFCLRTADYLRMAVWTIADLNSKCVRITQLRFDSLVVRAFGQSFFALFSVLSLRMMSHSALTTEVHANHGEVR